jgi:hypothetical protein
VVMFVDDVQWAGRPPVGFLDLVLSQEPIDGLLLVGAYRDGEVDATHPLAALLARWREAAGVRHLRLGNLPVSGSVTMVAEMLHADPAAAAGLAAMIEPHASGNPYQTVELLNALRRDGCWPRRPMDGSGTRRRCAPGWAGLSLPGCGRRGLTRCLRRRGNWWRRWRAWAGGPG